MIDIDFIGGAADNHIKGGILGELSVDQGRAQWRSNGRFCLNIHPCATVKGAEARGQSQVCCCAEIKTNGQVQGSRRAQAHFRAAFDVQNRCEVKTEIYRVVFCKGIAQVKGISELIG